MAYAKVVAQITGVSLTLNNNEAESLVAVLRRVGGHPDNTRRRFTADILTALEEAGVVNPYAPFEADFQRLIFSPEEI